MPKRTLFSTITFCFSQLIELVERLPIREIARLSLSDAEMVAYKRHAGHSPWSVGPLFIDTCLPSV